MEQLREAHQGCTHFSVCTSVSWKQQSAVRTQMPDTWKPGPFCPPWFPRAACRLLRAHLHSCLPYGWERGGGASSAPPSQWTGVSCSLPCRPSPGSYKTSLVRVSKQLPETDCAPAVVTQVSRDSGCCLFCHLPRILFAT